MSIKLIALDLDGTLLNSDKVVSKRTLDALQHAIDAGVYMTIATGRMFLSAAYFGEVVHANAPLICCNGGVVQELGAKEPLFARKLKPETVRKILTICHEHPGWYANWYIGTEIYVEKFLPEYFYAYRTDKNFRVREVGDDYLQYTENVLQCVGRNLTGEIPELVKAVVAACGYEVHPQQNTEATVDLTPPGVNKALGLSVLAEHLGLTRDEIMACGDSDNDLAMLEFAGTAVVPANGIPAAKELATDLVPSNDEDGIAQAVERLVLTSA